MNRQVEILAPAGSYECLRAAVCAGADAVYIGGAMFGARAYAKNLDETELLSAIDYVHIHGRKIYLTVNTLLKDKEIDQLYDYLAPYYLSGLDGVIVQDVGVIEYLKRYFPKLPIHASTQMTITGTKGASFLKDQGITRVVPARELSLAEIRRMKEETELEIECFVHGAMCYCYSGQCLLSSMIGGRSGNRGQCAQPCRLPYGAGGKGQADLMSLKDLCTIDLIPELIEAGIDSYKIEGRMKQPDYVYTVTAMYRKYADLYLEKGAGGYKVSGADREKLLGVYQRRGYTEGYYKRHNGKEMISFKHPAKLAQERVELDFKIQEKINGNLMLSVGKHAKLILEYHGYQVECEGDMVLEAKRQPLDAARIEKQMRKTGNTEFQFDRFYIETDGEVFLPMQALNELRRKGIQELTEHILHRYQRDAVELLEDKETKEDEGAILPRISLMVQSREQLETALDCEDVDIIYVDCVLGFREETARMLETVRKQRRYFLAMPHIFRNADADRCEKLYANIEKVYDGVLVRNWESFRWLKDHGYKGEVCSDSNMYVFNRYGKTFIKRQGISRFTAPLELNARELGNLDISGGVMGVYGYQPVMVTANCIQKTGGRCLKEEGYCYIRDRYQKKFTVRMCCPYCYNVIYNSSPLFLADKAEEITKLRPGELRMDFTVENAEELKRITELYADAFIRRKEMKVPKMEYTRGHFKRGVK